MSKGSPRLLGGGAKRVRSASLDSGPRTYLPFLVNVAKKAQGMLNTVGTSAPYRAYPQLSPGATKQPAGSSVLFKDDACIIVNDAFPKSFVHCLVMPLDLGLRSLNDLHYIKASPPPPSSARGTGPSAASSAAGHPTPLGHGFNHLQLLKHMDTTAQSYVAFLKKTDPAAYGSRRFITGFHSLPSLPMLHMHLISMDLDSPCLKTKKHYNSFATFFFLTADRVMEDLERNGCVTVNKNVRELEAMEKQEMTCLWCGEPLATMAVMKRHVPACPKNKSMVK